MPVSSQKCDSKTVNLDVDRLFMKLFKTNNIVYNVNNFTRATLGSAGTSCRHLSHVCLSVRLSQVGVLLKLLNVGSRKQRHTIARQRTVGFCSLPKFRQNSNRVSPNGGAKCSWGDRLNADAVAENWRLSTRSVINLVRSQVYHTERPLSSFAARSP